MATSLISPKGTKAACSALSSTCTTSTPIFLSSPHGGRRSESSTCSGGVPAPRRAHPRKGCLSDCSPWEGVQRGRGAGVRSRGEVRRPPQGRLTHMVECVPPSSSHPCCSIAQSNRSPRCAHSIISQLYSFLNVLKNNHMSASPFLTALALSCERDLRRFLSLPTLTSPPCCS